MSPFDQLLEDIKPTAYKIISESGTLIPDFIERRIADKYIRSTLVTLVAQYGPYVSSAINPVLPMAKNLFQEQYYKRIVTLKDIVDTPIYQFDSKVAVAIRNQIGEPKITK